MTTSGVVNQTTIDVVSIIEKAVRKCGVLPSVLGSEQLQNARDNLALNLVALSNRGVNLWCVTKRVMAPLAFQERIRLASDVVDILPVPLYRNGIYTAATSYAGASATVDYGVGVAAGVDSATVVATVAGDYHLKLEYSADGIAWFTSDTNFVPDVVIGQRVSVDVNIAAVQRFWRVSETVLTVTFAEALFVSNGTEVPMSQLPRSDYTSLPDKGFTSQQPLQYFFDKQSPNPQLLLWPTLQGLGPQVVLWIQRQIQDVGDLTNTLDVPLRWHKSIIFELAKQVFLELPKELVDKDRYPILTTEAEAATRSAEDGEVDGAPLRLQPNIRGYTA